MNANKPLIAVIIWADMSGLRNTGRTVLRDLNYFPEIVPCKTGKAVIWSRDLSRFNDGQKHAESIGGKCILLPDTDDILSKARALAIKLLNSLQTTQNHEVPESIQN